MDAWGYEFVSMVGEAWLAFGLYMISGSVDLCTAFSGFMWVFIYIAFLLFLTCGLFPQVVYFPFG